MRASSSSHSAYMASTSAWRAVFSAKRFWTFSTSAELTRASADIEKVQNLFAEKTALQAEVDAMYAEGEELEALVAAADVT